MTTACSYPPLEAGGKGDGGKGEIEILADSTAELFEGEEDEGDWKRGHYETTKALVTAAVVAVGGVV